MVKTLIPQREHFNGAELLSPVWTVRKGRKSATCQAWSHQFGFELRVTISHELVQSQVCCSQPDMITLQEEWRAAFVAKGWA